MLDLLGEFGYDSVFRMWNFVGDINGDNAEGLEVYRDFCRGRAEAFEQCSVDSRSSRPRPGSVRSAAGSVSICWPAVRWAREHREPAPGARLPLPEALRSAFPALRQGHLSTLRSGQIYVSGTAAVLGHDRARGADRRPVPVGAGEHRAVDRQAQPGRVRHRRRRRPHRPDQHQGLRPARRTPRHRARTVRRGLLAVGRHRLPQRGHLPVGPAGRDRSFCSPEAPHHGRIASDDVGDSTERGVGAGRPAEQDRPEPADPVERPADRTERHQSSRTASRSPSRR